MFCSAKKFMRKTSRPTQRMTGALPLVTPPPFEKGGRKLFVYYFLQAVKRRFRLFLFLKNSAEKIFGAVIYLFTPRFFVRVFLTASFTKNV